MNALILPVGTRGVRLHSYWDGRLGGNGPISALEWEGREAYEARCGPVVQARLAEAARNLAALVERLADQG